MSKLYYVNDLKHVSIGKNNLKFTYGKKKGKRRGINI